MLGKKKSFFIVVILTLFLLIGFQNCTDPKLTLRKDYYSLASKLGFCTSPSDSIKSNLKFIFVVDRSGSNQTNYILNPDGSFSDPLPGTDPNGDRRFSALESFIQNYKGGEEQYIYWSMVSFANNSKTAIPFTNNKSSFLGSIQSEHATSPSKDGGSTNYEDGFNRVLNMIKTDVEDSRAKKPMISSNYVVFFVSDGVPYIGGTIQPENKINSQIESILSIREGSEDLIDGIQINTAYYYSSMRDASASQRLTNMSGFGKGSFLEFAEGENIDFSRFALPLRISRFDLKEFWVVNSNTVWEGDTLKRDSDADGLSDELETTLGSDPFEYDTDKNGVGDGVEYRSSGNTSPCQNADCSFVGKPYSSCGGAFDDPSNYTFQDSDKDWLNDCEETLLGSDSNNFDTNSDYIPDHLAFISQISITEVSNAAYLDPDNDGYNDYQELKMNTPLRVNNSSVNGMKVLSYHADLVSQSIHQDCYNISISGMAYDTQDDKIRAYVMENTKTLTEKRIMRRAEKSLSSGAVNFIETDFY